MKSIEKSLPLISVITPVFNGEKYIEEALQSVINQTYKNVEHIVIDGQSTDGTLEILAKHKSNIDCLISEKDENMYQAIFKGFSLAKGDILCWINADDKLMPWALEVVAKEFRIPHVNWVTGMPGFWGERGELKFVGKIRWYPKFLIKWGCFHHLALGCIQQESTFFSKELYRLLTEQELNNILSCKSAGDYHLWRCFAKHASLKTMPTIVSGFRVHNSNMSKDLRFYLDEVGVKGFYSLHVIMWLPIRLMHVFASFVYSSYLYMNMRKKHGLVHYFSKKFNK